MSRIDLVVPDIGNFADILVVNVLVKQGDAIEVDAPLVTLETDKASMDVPATSAGTVTEVLLKAGDKVSKGTVIARLETDCAGGWSWRRGRCWRRSRGWHAYWGWHRRGRRPTHRGRQCGCSRRSDRSWSYWCKCRRRGRGRGIQAAFDADELERTVTQPVLSAAAAQAAAALAAGVMARWQGRSPRRPKRMPAAVHAVRSVR